MTTEVVLFLVGLLLFAAGAAIALLTIFPWYVAGLIILGAGMMDIGYVLDMANT